MTAPHTACLGLRRRAARAVAALVLTLVGATAWAGVAFVGQTTAALSSSPVASLQINAPAALAAGHLMVAFLAQNAGCVPLIGGSNQNGSCSGSGSAPAGWTAVLKGDNGSDLGVLVYYKVAAAADVGSSFTWSFSGSGRSLGAILAFSGVDPTAPVAASGWQLNAASTSMGAPMVTTTAPNSLLLALFAARNGGVTATAPSGLTEVVDAATSAGPNGVQIEVAHGLQAAAGSSGAKVATASASVVSIGSLLALTPATGSGVDHYELSLASSSLACSASTVTVTACATGGAPCSSPATTLAGATATLSTAGATLGSASLSFNSSGVASTTLIYPTATEGSVVAVTLSAESVAASGARQCCANGSSCAPANSCNTTFHTAGFIVAGSANGASATLPAQTAGTSSGPYYLRAVRTSTSTQACEAAMTGTTSVNWAAQCNNPGTCSSGNLMTLSAAGSSAIAANPGSGVSSSTAVAMTFDANGNAPFSFNYADVGQVTLWASKTVNGATLAGNSNAFVVKPAGFAITAVRQTASPNLVNPAAASATGTKFVKAGEAFSATVTALTSAGAAAPNFGRESSPEGVLLTPTLVLPSGGINGSLNNGTLAGGSFSAGVVTASNLSYSEVGIITLNAAVADGDYLGAGNVSTAGGTTIGRFVPAQFALSGGSVTHRSALACAPASAFSYQGENFRLAFTLTAQNMAGATTQNYSGSFAKLDPTAAAGWNLAGLDGSTAFSAASARLSLGSATGAWSNGVATGVTLSANVPRAGVPDGPFNAGFGVAPTDSDGVALGSFNMASTAGGANDRGTVASVALRHGRLRLANAIGAADRPLALPVSAQSWSGSAWDTNTLDSCTTVPTSAISHGNLRRTLTAADLNASAGITLTTGQGLLRFAAPGGGRSGTFDVALSLGSSSTDQSCLQTWTPDKPATAGAGLAYLRGAWCGSNLDKDASARVTFGLQRTQVNTVFRRENY